MSSLQLRSSLAFLSLAFAGGTIELARTPSLISFADPIGTPLAEASSASRSDAAITSLPVIYHQTPSPHNPPMRGLYPAATPRMVKTSKPFSLKQRAGLYKTASQTDSSQSKMLLTIAHTRNATRTISRPVQIVATDFSPSYAAVPFAGGWLIIQL